MCTFSCQLTQLAEKLGATSITQNKLLMHDNTALRTALIDWINREEEFDEEEGEEDTDMVLIQDWLRKQADTWPVHAGTPPVEGHEADDAHWWAKTRGYEIKLCPDATKGRGVFATRRQRKGSVVGVYWGEYLTRRQFVARHGWRHGVPIVPTEAERAEITARRARLDALSPEQGRPMGGSENGGSYALLLLPETPNGTRGFGELASYVDAEDPTRSGWCRYVNHAETAEEGCNAEVRVDALRKLVWLELSRDVMVGEEVCFHYGDGNELSVAAQRRPQARTHSTSKIAEAREVAAGWGKRHAASSCSPSSGGSAGAGADTVDTPSWPDDDLSWCGL